MPIELLAETVTLNLGILALFGALFTFGGALIGGAIAWGALRSTVSKLEKTVDALESNVRMLSEKVAVLVARDMWESETKRGIKAVK